ncbi:addiction module antidote protein [Leisingera sp. ANG59]|uniref:addiction module antidote protein n=1 Tax=Leisingera sp. ANG59 TaxID=2675221 RepID=UPI0015731576|nr:putative addiction module antidote protein [Leisingera sp. ANG59]
MATVARARGMTEIAKAADVTRQALYKGLSEAGDPKLSTVLGVMKALSMKVTVEAGV